MQNQNWRLIHKVIAVATVTVLIAGFTTLAVAQQEDASAIFATAAKVSTSVEGVSVFAAPPNNFNPLTASNRELLSYGLPQAPDKTANAKAYDQWQ